ncbi:MAG: Lrp/AsnC ligand binding domain-containing protein [Rhodococcus sp. (in: high G+C Gram-positive bacteria)]
MDDATPQGICKEIARIFTRSRYLQSFLLNPASLPAINRIYRITGEDCFVLDVHTATPEDLETVIDAIGRFGPVSTSLVLRKYPAHPIAPTHDR